MVRNSFSTWSEDEIDLVLLAVALIKSKEKRKKRIIWVQDITVYRIGTGTAVPPRPILLLASCLFSFVHVVFSCFSSPTFLLSDSSSTLQIKIILFVNHAVVTDLNGMSANK